ncbi:MAG: hypothetical protein ACLGPL_08710, partial [Acidobacteriota bacterium]
MRTKPAWTLQSFLTCFLLNAALIGVLFYAAKQIIVALRKWVDPFLVAGSANLQEDFQRAFTGLDIFLKQ